MSKKGENIYKRKDGRWEGRFIMGCDAYGRAKYYSCYGRTYREAREKLYAARAEALRGEEPAAGCGRRRFGVYCDEWLRLNRSRVKESSYVKYEAMAEKHIKPFLGECTVSALSTAMVGQLCRELLGKGLSAKTVRDVLSIVHAVLEYIRSQEPGLHAVKIIYPKEERREMRVLSVAEQRRLTEYLSEDTDECKFGVLLALLTGLRLGEICALRWSGISLSERTLTVSSTMLRLRDYSENAPKKTHIVLTDPKTGTSSRTIPLTDFTFELCRRHKADEPDAFILTGECGRYIEPRTLQNRFKKYAAECGLADVSFHALRHTFATRCVEVGFEIKSLSEILGHTSPKFTLERYVHSSMDLKRDNMNKLSAIGC